MKISLSLGTSLLRLFLLVHPSKWPRPGFRFFRDSCAVHPTGLLAVVGRQAPRSDEVGVSTMPAVGVMAAKVKNQWRASFWQNEPNFV